MTSARRLCSIGGLILGLSVVAVLGWLSQHYRVTADFGAHVRGALPAPLRALLRELPGPLLISAEIAGQPALRERVRAALEPWKQAKPDIELRFVEPVSAAAALRLGNEGRLVLRVGEREESVYSLGEQELALALRRLARSSEVWIAFLAGHGERDVMDTAASGYDKLARLLRQEGYGVVPLNLVATPSIPGNVTVLVLPAPQSALEPGAAQLIDAFVERGGALLWLQETAVPSGLEALAERLSLEILPGTVISADTRLRQLLGIRHPAVIPIIDYGDHPLTRGFEGQTLFALARAVRSTGQPPWQAVSILRTLPDSWNETGSLQGTVHHDPERGEEGGPLSLGIAQSRVVGDREQRVALLGDSDFMSNEYLGYAQNSRFALRLFAWLTDAVAPAEAAPDAPADTELQLSSLAETSIAFGFLVALPLIFAGWGGWIWYRRGRG